jgi:multiple RNA-binding domain-containing protein 1
MRPQDESNRDNTLQVTRQAKAVKGVASEESSEVQVTSNSGDASSEDDEVDSGDDAVGPSAAAPISDMDYLRSKMKAKIDVDAVAPPAVLDEASESDEDADEDEKSDDDAGSGQGDEDAETANATEEACVEKDEAEHSGRVYVRNLPFLATEEELTALFVKHGEVTSVHIPVDESRRSKGYAFVQFVLSEHAKVRHRRAQSHSHASDHSLCYAVCWCRGPSLRCKAAFSRAGCCTS